MDLKALHTISYGMYVIGSNKGDKLNAQIANTLVQACSDPPPLITVCINKENLTHEFIRDSGVFTASVLSQETPLNFIGRFGFKSGRDMNKLEGVNYKTGETGAPIVLDNTLAYLEAKVVQEISAKTHHIFLSELVAAEVIKAGTPMTYSYYHQVKRGTTPKSAPSYIEEQKKEDINMDKYQCGVCGYVYDPAEGDPDNDIPPGTPFDKLPDDWVCPVCGAEKSEFEKI